MNSSGSVTATNVFGGDGLVGRTGAANVYYVFDQQGNVAQRLNSSQGVTSSSTYDAYGAETSTGSPVDPFGYNAKWGYYFDREAGIHKCTFRDYDPSTGRWLTRDPIGFNGGINLYAGCRSEPCMLVDHTGLFSLPRIGKGIVLLNVADLIKNCFAEILLLQAGLVKSTDACEDCLKDAAGAIGAIAGGKFGSQVGGAIGRAVGTAAGAAAGTIGDPGGGTWLGGTYGGNWGDAGGRALGAIMGPNLGRKLAELAIKPYLKDICKALADPCNKLPDEAGHIVPDEDPNAYVA
jgi:RHS repeat-associated protein